MHYTFNSMLICMHVYLLIVVETSMSDVSTSPTQSESVFLPSITSSAATDTPSVQHISSSGHPVISEFYQTSILVSLPVSNFYQSVESVFSSTGYQIRSSDSLTTSSSYHTKTSIHTITFPSPSLSKIDTIFLSTSSVYVYRGKHTLPN
mgnify:CR=1 FL=1